MNEKSFLKKRFYDISIFYSDQQWWELLGKGMFLFLKQAGNKYDYKFIIYFSKDRGDHVGICIQTEESTAHLLLKDLDENIKKFLSDNPSRSTIQENNSSKIFMNFPNNSIQYGVNNFSSFPFNEMDQNYINLWHSLSEILLKNLSKYPFSFEHLFALRMRFELLLRLSYQADPIKRASSSKQILESKPDNFDWLYNENKEILQNIWIECCAVKNGTSNNELKWINDYMKSITEFINCCKQKDDDSFRICSNIKAGLNRQLGINEEANALLNYFIQNLLNKNSYEKAGLFNSHTSSN